MYALTFIFSDNKRELNELLNSKNYKKIGHKKKNPIGYCILIAKKQYFEIEAAKNPDIMNTSELLDVKVFC